MTASDRKRLERMSLDIRFNEFLEVIKYMLDHGVKLEQEAELDI